MQRNVLVTGGSGFLGRALLKEMLAVGADHFHVLLRSDKAEAAILRQLGTYDRRRLTFCRGDVTLPNLGISADELTPLSRKVDEVWHMAASTSFDSRQKAEIESVNVGGTRNVLSALTGFPRLRAFFHISTAYVCGNADGVVPEDFLPRPTTFKNVYEESKYEAELLVRDSGLPFIVIRPSILVGDSTDGSAFGEGRMVYGYLRAIYRTAVQRLGSPSQFWDYWHNATNGCPPADVGIRLYGDPAAGKNVVTLDDAVRVCLKVRQLATIDRVYNVVNPSPITFGRMIELASRALRVQGFVCDPTLGQSGRDHKDVIELLALRQTRAFWPYTLLSDPTWHSQHVAALGADRVTMTDELFRFLMDRYVMAELHTSPN